MRHLLAPIALLLILAAPLSPARANDDKCPRPKACTTMARIANGCELDGPCDSLLPVVKALETPTKCQRKIAADLHAFSLCDKHDQDRAFSILAHAKSRAIKRYFCSDNFKHMIKRRQSLKEKYAYATVPFDPASKDDEVAQEDTYYYATITNCRKVK